MSYKGKFIMKNMEYNEIKELETFLKRRMSKDSQEYRLGRGNYEYEKRRPSGILKCQQVRRQKASVMLAGE